MGSSRNSPIVISDDEEEEPAVLAPAADGDGSDNGGIPGWLPDGFEMGGYYLEDGNFRATVRPIRPSMVGLALAFAS